MFFSHFRGEHFFWMRTMRRKRYRCSALVHQGKGYNTWNLQFWLVLKWIIIEVFKWCLPIPLPMMISTSVNVIPFTCMLMSNTVPGSMKASLSKCYNSFWGPIYTERQPCVFDVASNIARLIAYKFLNTPRELLWNGLQCQIEPERQRGRSVDADAQCKWT